MELLKKIAAQIKKITFQTDKIIDLMLRWISMICLAGIFGILIWNITARIDFNPANMIKKSETVIGEESANSISETEEEAVDIFSMMKKTTRKKVARWALPTLKWQMEIIAGLFGWMIFFGSASLWRARDHFKIDWLFNKISPTRYGFIFHLALETISLAFLLILGFYGVNHTAVNATQYTQILRISLSPIYICIPITAFLMSIYSIRNIVQIVISVIKKEYDPVKKSEQTEEI